MVVEQIYTGCLAQGAYYIESNGEAAVIDPLREPYPYMERAGDAKIKYILETHFHADFVSGHVDLAKSSGATIVYGPNAETGFDAHIASDGEVLKVGDVTITVLHTPGHTMESTTYLLKDEQGNDTAIFTGDTLFIGDVGRPDLAQKAGKLTMEDLAGHLFDSLRNKIMPLSDDITVYPAHGAGSACGKNMSKETFDTLGNQKQTNYALRADMSREEFIKEVTDGLMAPPAYFPENVRLNKEGSGGYDEVIEKGTRALDPEAFELAANATRALILDTRSKEAFAQAHIPGSIFIGLDGNFAPWVGALIPDIQQEILLITDKGRETEAVKRLSRVGYDNCIGYLEDSLDSWKAAGKDIATLEEITAEDLSALAAKEKVSIVDVRKVTEHEAESVADSLNLPLDSINSEMAALSNGRHYVHCASGYRSVIAISILAARGIENLVNVKGGIQALRDTDLELTAFVCPSTKK